MGASGSKRALCRHAGPPSLGKDQEEYINPTALGGVALRRFLYAFVCKGALRHGADSSSFKYSKKTSQPIAVADYSGRRFLVTSF